MVLTIVINARGSQSILKSRCPYLLGQSPRPACRYYNAIYFNLLICSRIVIEHVVCIMGSEIVVRS